MVRRWAIALVCGLGCWQTAGPTLGLLLGSTTFAAMLTGPLVCGQDDWAGRSFAAAGIFVGDRRRLAGAGV